MFVFASLKLRLSGRLFHFEFRSSPARQGEG